MAHHHNNSAYGRLTDRLNRFPQGAPASDMLFGILKILFSEKEAGLVAQLPIKPFTAQTAAAAWKLPLAQARNILDELAGRAVLLDMDIRGGADLLVFPRPWRAFSSLPLCVCGMTLTRKPSANCIINISMLKKTSCAISFVQGETGLGRVFVREDVLGDP